MKLQLYVLRQLLLSLAFAVGGILFVALPGLAVNTVHRMPGADALVLLRYIPIAVQTLSPYVLPVCFLLAVVATYGRLAADREWTAIQMAGIRPIKLLAPPLAVGLLLSGGTYWMLCNQLPLLKTTQRQLLIEASTSILQNLRPGRTSVQLQDFQLDAQWMDPETGVLHEVFIRRPGTREEGNEGDRIDYHAKTARLAIEEGVLRATLTDLFQFHADREVAQSFHEWVEFELPLDYLGERKASERPRYKTSKEILRLLAAGAVEPRLLRSYHFELHYRGALASVFLLFLGLGAPTGLILRRGTQLGALAVSSGYALLVYVLNLRLSKDLGRGPVPPALAAWTPTLLGFVASFFLLRRAMRR